MFALGHALGAIAAETAAEIDSSDAGKLSGQRGGYIDIGHNNQANAANRVSAPRVYILCTPRERKGMN
jgi:hypothetical protein